MRSVRRAWDVPVDELSLGDLRVVLAQGWPDTFLHLVPLALDALETDPLVAATFYEGDLLSCVLSPHLDAYWATHLQERVRLDEVYQTACSSSNSDEVSDPVKRALAAYAARRGE
ncbi:MAG: contact-dependent growth inhibition system immunity protein [Sandaracinaceae bacterium]